MHSDNIDYTNHTINNVTVLDAEYGSWEIFIKKCLKPYGVMYSLKVISRLILCNMKQVTGYVSAIDNNTSTVLLKG